MTESVPTVVMITRENARDVLREAITDREPTEEEVSKFLLFVVSRLDDCLKMQAIAFYRMDNLNGYA
jgi:hypothetical protein